MTVKRFRDLSADRTGKSPRSSKFAVVLAVAALDLLKNTLAARRGGRHRFGAPRSFLLDSINLKPSILNGKVQDQISTFKRKYNRSTALNLPSPENKRTEKKRDYFQVAEPRQAKLKKKK